MLSVEDGDLGFNGHVRPGGWVPLRLTVDNPTADDLELEFGWTVSDADGDRVVSRRTAVINAQRTERLWLYAPVPLSAEADAAWTVQARSTEEAEGDIAAGVVAEPMTLRPDRSRWVPPGTGLIALMSQQDLGLDDYARHVTQHEPLTVVRGLSLADLPDRAHGLGALDAVIWTADTGGDPADASVPARVFPAIREYVLRGGHLVIVLPRVGQTWTQSPLADLLPVPASGVRRVTGPFPMIGGVRPDGVELVSLHTFDPRNTPGATVRYRNEDGSPLIVSARRGFGYVTLVGMDLTDASYRGALNFGERRIWNTVFGWTSPVYNAEQVRQRTGQADGRASTLRPASEMSGSELASFVPGRIAMRGTVSLILLVAIALLLLYIAAAAGSFGWVRLRGKAHLAWLAFGGVVAGFSVLAWGGAWFARPTGLQVRHVSILDLDSTADTARVRSWVSLFVPRFGVAETGLPEAPVPGLADAPANTLAALGVSADDRGAGFLDAQRYDAAAADPSSLALPVRATTKRLTLDVLTTTTLDAEAQSGAEALLGPAAVQTLEAPSHDLASGRLSAQLRHTLPGPLHDVTVVYCPGEGFGAAGREVLTPWVWRALTDDATGQRRPWEAGQTLEIDGRPSNALPLYRLADGYDENRRLKDEGFLGQLLDQHAGVAVNITAGDDAVTRRLELLSFFDAVPPPAFHDTSFTPPGPIALRRAIGRAADLTDLLHGPRLIVLGHLRDAPLPADLTVDGQRPPSQGWVMVRIIYDLEP